MNLHITQKERRRGDSEEGRNRKKGGGTVRKGGTGREGVGLSGKTTNTSDGG